MCRNRGENCEKCLGGQFGNCTRGKCVHGSLAKSWIGSMEATFWKWMRVYRNIDTIICPSHFMKSMLDSNPVLAEKTVTMHNFVDPVEQKVVHKKNYVLYFGRYSKEKGIETLVQAAKEMPEIPFVFAGSGPLEHLLEGVPNIQNVGFQTGEVLEMLIREARFSVYPSEWYENCPFSVMESIMYGTPVLAANIGGIPELIRVGETGELFESGSIEKLKQIIEVMWNDGKKLAAYAESCKDTHFYTAEEYTEELIKEC